MIVKARSWKTDMYISLWRQGFQRRNSRERCSASVSEQNTTTIRVARKEPDIKSSDRSSKNWIRGLGGGRLWAKACVFERTICVILDLQGGCADRCCFEFVLFRFLAGPSSLLSFASLCALIPCVPVIFSFSSRTSSPWPYFAIVCHLRNSRRSSSVLNSPDPRFSICLQLLHVRAKIWVCCIFYEQQMEGI